MSRSSAGPREGQGAVIEPVVVASSSVYVNAKHGKYMTVKG